MASARSAPLISLIASRFAVAALCALPFARAHAVPETGWVSRLGMALTTWQEPLRLQLPSGSTELSVANYKGYFISYEQQRRFKGGGFSANFSFGSGQASGGGTSPSFDYQRGSIAWTAFQVQPRFIYALTERIDAGISVAGVYRSASWPETDAMKVTPSRQIYALFLVEADFALTERWGFRQSLGIGTLEVGPFWRWGLSYDL